MVRNPPYDDFFSLHREPLREASHWLLVIGLGFFLADAATATLEQRLAVTPIPLPKTVVAALAQPSKVVAPPDMAKLLATTEPAEMASLPAASDAAPVPAQMTEASVPVTLVGCMAGVNGAGLALLTVAGESLAAGTEQPVLDWTVKEVLPTSIVIERKGSIRALELDQPTDLATATRPATTLVTGTAPVAPGTPPSTTPAVEPAASPTPTAKIEPITTQREIRDLLDKHMNDFIQQGSIKPVVRDGQVIGYGIKVKNPAFPLARLGLLTGDIVKSVNGTPCTGPGDIGKLMGILRNSSLSFEIERDGKAMTHKVELEP